ncbi:hypothetical protein BY996DRAFT_6423482 [Phakopsora pachyrhizi]|nr:hypothetical protein BY996DRAFT_6426852 [Phakopsora pachyrhizi]KAI8445839.1 hypothetical protein BY996DRAFT_6423482 [Phakopsora pachyrhizi]
MLPPLLTSSSTLNILPHPSGQHWWMWGGKNSSLGWQVPPTCIGINFATTEEVKGSWAREGGPGIVAAGSSQGCPVMSWLAGISIDVATKDRVKGRLSREGCPAQAPRSIFYYYYYYNSKKYIILSVKNKQRNIN